MSEFMFNAGSFFMRTDHGSQLNGLPIVVVVPTEARWEGMNPFRPRGGDLREWNPFHSCCEMDGPQTCDEMDGDMRIYRRSRARWAR